MFNFITLLCALMGGTPHVSNFPSPTGDVRPGEILIESDVPSQLYCDHWGGFTIQVDNLIYCIDEDF